MKRSRSGSDLHFIEAPNNIDSADYNDRLHSPSCTAAPSSCCTPSLMSPVPAAAGAHHSHDAADQSRPPNPAPFSKPPSVCSSSCRGLSSSIPAAIAQSAPKLSSSTTSGGEVLMQAAAAANSANIFGGWPCRSYGCSFCGREFNSAQALGGHMNIHRRDRARLRTSLENFTQPSPALLMSAADNYQSTIFPSPHAAARHSLNDVANLPFSASLGEYYREQPGIMTAPRSQLDMVNRGGAMFNPLRPRPSGASSAAVSPFATDQIPFHHSPQLPIMTLAAAPSTQPAAAASSFSDLPLQSSVRATNAALIMSTSCTSDSARPRSPSDMSRTCQTRSTQLSTGTVFPFHIASERPYCSIDGARPALSSKQSSGVLTMGPDLNSLQCIAGSPAMAQPGFDPSSILDLELRLGQSASPAGSR